MASTPVPLIVTLYRWTTRLMPASNRHQYAEEQVRLFEQVWSEERPAGTVAGAWWAMVLFWRSILAAVAARFDHRRRTALGRLQGRGGSFRVGQDLRFTLRSLKASSWYGAAVVGVIAVTIALATTTFAIVDGVLFRPLPYPEADRLVGVRPDFKDAAPATSVPGPVSYVDLANWLSAVPEVQFTGFRAARAAESGPGVRLGQDTAGIADVQANFFDVVGVRPLFGGFAANDFVERARYRPVVLMYDTWQARFGGDPSVVGRIEMLIRPRDFGLRVVGVMPPGFTFPSSRVDVDFLAPMVPSAPETLTNPRSRPIAEVVARLPAGMRTDDLVARLAPGLAATAVQYNALGGPSLGFDPKTQHPYDMVTVKVLSAALAERSRDLFLGAFAAAALLILLAAANVSSLMAARALERRGELDVRRSLGATRGAIIRLWWTEAVVLLAAGSILGAVIAAPLLALIVSVLPESIVLLKVPRIDWRVAGFVVVSMGLLSAIVSVAPIRWSLRRPAGGAPRGGSSERVRTPGRFAVIAGQVAAAFVLTTVGACLVASLLTVYGTDLPIRIAGVVVLESRLHGPGGRRNDVSERVTRGRLLRQRFGQIPGVIDVGLVEAEVLRGGGLNNGFTRPEGIANLPDLDTWGVTGGFYRVIDPVVTAGRLPTEQELDAGEPLLVVSERVARSYWPGENPIGQTLADLGAKVSHTVVGVIRDVRWHGWDRESPMIYGPYARLTDSPFQTYFIRTERDAAATIREAVGAVVKTDPTMRPRTAATLEEMYLASVALRRFQSWLFGSFAAASLLVVGVGIFGLIAMSTARRTKEVGIRCALGATPGGVTALMVREQLGAVAAGLIAGGGIATWAVGLVEGYLYEVTTTDVRIWGTAVALILVMAATGSLIPAVRASRIDPLKALRVE